MSLVVNLRTLAVASTGVQRYAREIANRLDGVALPLRPDRKLDGVAGHCWEQMVLPRLAARRLLFSPANTGPLVYPRQVVTIHDATTFDCADAFGVMFAAWYRFVLPRLARAVRHVITVSEFSRRRLLRVLPIGEDKVSVIYNGVGLPPAPPTPSEMAAVRQAHRLPERYLLFVGSQDPRKNLRRLVGALETLGDQSMTLVVAGGGNPGVFRAAASGSDEVRLIRLGHVREAELECLYAGAAALVFPSLYEGFGLPPLEAMARGCPVLCARASCLPEICGPEYGEGGACLYFDPTSVDAIAQTLRTFWTLPGAARAGMIERGRRHAARFSWDRCARETLAVLERVRRASARE